jgi:hypothetical protein
MRRRSSSFISRICFAEERLCREHMALALVLLSVSSHLYPMSSY